MSHDVGHGVALAIEEDWERQQQSPAQQVDEGVAVECEFVSHSAKLANIFTKIV